ncbi:hypothetical protein F8568_005475 [Actinomadura sp. LD22]|uniref:Uncharacterized protein n=1 Tax=Actinomadura physcomitrii TaxID=2650748 RepID=A0A6I4M1M3_9ACTN|nr:hypothetical protein [Actinomadura physcomitrii]MVZ99837.1 hypothetical protein [Actinomadura physcomitrii]
MIDQMLERVEARDLIAVSRTPGTHERLRRLGVSVRYGDFLPSGTSV